MYLSACAVLSCVPADSCTRFAAPHHTVRNLNGPFRPVSTPPITRGPPYDAGKIDGNLSPVRGCSPPLLSRSTGISGDERISLFLNLYELHADV